MASRAMNFPFTLALGLAAGIMTAVIIVLEGLILCASSRPASLSRVLAAVALSAEGVVLIIIVAKCIHYVWGTGGYRLRYHWAVWFVLDLVASVLASAVSAVLLIVTGQAKDMSRNIANVSPIGLVIGSAIALGSAFLAQLLFVVVYSTLHRRPDQALSLHTNEDGRLLPQFPMRLKSVPYERTKPAERHSLELSSRSRTSSERSIAETISLFPMPSVVRPVGSKTRLLSSTAKPVRRLDSLDSIGCQDQIGVMGDGFDSWDTSSVDPCSRQAVLEISSPTRTRYPGAIPASLPPNPYPPPDRLLPELPKPVRRAAAARPRNLEPLKPGRRDAGHGSPALQAQQPQPQQQQQQVLKNVHPLYRSDSPRPPPPATPGTVVVAAPYAGQSISSKSVTQMRVGSLPKSPSPLSREWSHESLVERNGAPPIPDWVLNAGSDTSLAQYNRHKRGRHGTVAEEDVIVPIVQPVIDHDGAMWI